MVAHTRTRNSMAATIAFVTNAAVHMAMRIAMDTVSPEPELLMLMLMLMRLSLGNSRI